MYVIFNKEKEEVVTEDNKSLDSQPLCCGGEQRRGGFQ